MGSQSQSPQESQARPLVPANASNGTTSTLSSGGSRFNSLARQSSIYSLTLDEFQNAMTDPGKAFGSMNMDEFLKNIWTAEESQAMATAMAGSGEGGVAGSARLPRQASLPRTLRRKTVDEVWRDIQNGTTDTGGEPPPTSAPHQREATFGEMTLEDFLVKAGVVRDEAEAGSQAFGAFVGGMGTADRERDAQGGGDRVVGGDCAPTLSLSPANALPSQATIDAMQMDAYNKNQAVSQQQQADWYRSMAQQQQILAAEAFVKRMGNGAGPMVGMPGMGLGGPMGGGMGRMPVGGLVMGVGGGMGVNMGLTPGSPPSPVSDSGQNGQSLSPLQYGMDGALRGRKRGPDGPVEKVVERRQKRMIKNRESAARSRARKQAYTVELEAEVTQLKEENLRLRKQQEEEAERRKKQIMEMFTRMDQQATPQPKTLRRTKTASW